MTGLIFLIIWVLGFVPAFALFARWTLRFPAWKKVTREEFRNNKSVLVLFSVGWPAIVPVFGVIELWDWVIAKYSITKGPLDLLIDWSYAKERGKSSE